MQIKKYVANSIQEALRQVKKELGPEALILSVNNIKAKTGPLALMSPARVEVTAAIDEDAPAYKYPAPAQYPASVLPSTEEWEGGIVEGGRVEGGRVESGNVESRRVDGRRVESRRRGE